MQELHKITVKFSIRINLLYSLLSNVS